MADYQLFPALKPEERNALRNDIAARGVMVPVLIDENGDILDGHHRVEIASELGRDYPVEIIDGLSEDEKLELIFSLNIARRHLSGHDRTGVIAQLRQRGMSLRAIAEVVGVSHTQVRNDLVAAEVETNFTPPTPEPEREPLPLVQTRKQRALELREDGLTFQQIADEMGTDNGTVSHWINGTRGDTGGDLPVEWSATRDLITSLETFAASDPRRIAASVPEKNRRATAKRLRQVGKFLGSIAFELEGTQR